MELLPPLSSASLTRDNPEQDTYQDPWRQGWSAQLIEQAMAIYVDSYSLPSIQAPEAGLCFAWDGSQAHLRVGSTWIGE